ncbi:TIR domain-containing protein [bacterium]|nr:MAG: TIR domain-containing protein [bacterium]
MFRFKRSDTTVESIENTYGIELNARADMRLANLLLERGFDSLSQLLRAYHGQLSNPSRTRKLFLSFHAEDRIQVTGFRLMAHNKYVNFDFYDNSVREAINSDTASYIKMVIREKIRKASILVCLIGNGTAWRDWVDWEINTAYLMHKGVCGIRLKGSRGRVPQILREHNAPIAQWNLDNITAVIERAAARRS